MKINLIVLKIVAFGILFLKYLIVLFILKRLKLKIQKKETIAHYVVKPLKIIVIMYGLQL